MPPRCRRCREGETLSKPLFRCARCSRCYHSACHRPHPREPTSHWVCKRCLADHGQEKRRRLYHDSSLLPPRAVSPSAAAASGLDKPLRTRMAPSAATDSATETPAPAISTSPNSFLQPRPSGGLIIKCPFPGCFTKIDGRRHVLCEAHLRLQSKAGQSGDAPPTNGAHLAPALAGAASTPREPIASTNPRKLLPDTDKDRPIMRRKTAGHLPQSIPQQPTPRPSIPPSRGSSAMSPPSVQSLAPRPAVQSPPASPVPLRDGEPANKRQRLSSPAVQSHRLWVNGTETSRPATTESRAGKEPAESDKPQSLNQSPNGSPQRSAKAKETEHRTGPRPSSKHPVRRIPLQLVNLRFIDDPADGLPGVLTGQSKSGMNGTAGGFPVGFHGVQRPSLDDGVKTSWTGRMSDSAVSDQRSELVPFPSRRAQITKTRTAPPPKPKEVEASRFDSLIYSQPGTSDPPPGVTVLHPAPPEAERGASAVPLRGKKEEEDEPLYLDIDPRIHWPQEHSAAWYAAKQKEIQARGTRKSHFGRAAQSLKVQQQLREKQGVEFEDTLPEKVLENPAWVRVLRKLRGLPPQDQQAGDEQTDGGGKGGGVDVGGQGLQKRGRKPVISGRRLGSGGMVVFTGLNGSCVPRGGSG